MGVCSEVDREGLDRTYDDDSREALEDEDPGPAGFAEAFVSKIVERLGVCRKRTRRCPSSAQ